MNKYKNIKYSIFTLSILTIIGCGTTNIDKNSLNDNNQIEASEDLLIENIKNDNDLLTKANEYAKENNLKLIKNEIVGDYNILTFTRYRTDGSTDTITKKINIYWDTTPRITLNGEPYITLNTGDTYVDLGVSVVDREDGELMADTIINKDFNTSIPGVYEFLYTVSDSNNNYVSMKRTVEVIGDPIYHTCNEILLNEKNPTNGEYNLISAKTGEEFSAICDFTTDGLGYTLKKIDSENMVTRDMEKICEKYDLQLFVPRTKEHLENSLSTIGNEYFHLMGIYPKEKGNTCINVFLNSDTCTTWGPKDGGRYFISDTFSRPEPNGDNDVDGSMYYAWNSDNSINYYNDIRNSNTGSGYGGLGGYSSNKFVCSAKDEVLYKSCKDIKDHNKDIGDGYYVIDPTGGDYNDSFKVYCDMTTDGGGWTLIGRTNPTDSTGIAETNFGWKYSVGAVDDFTSPYSMDVYHKMWVNGIKFSEIIYGNRKISLGDSNKWGGNIIKKEGLPTDFLDSYNSTVIGPNELISTMIKQESWFKPFPYMQAYIGNVDLNNRFFMRDVRVDSNTYGIKSSKLVTTYCGRNDSDLSRYSGPFCNLSGDSDKDSDQTMIFVR